MGGTVAAVRGRSYTIAHRSGFYCLAAIIHRLIAFPPPPTAIPPWLLGEAKKQDVLKDQAMLKRLNDIASFPEEDKQHILYTLDALIKNVKLKQM
jgi:hypothetical protein